MKDEIQKLHDSLKALYENYQNPQESKMTLQDKDGVISLKKPSLLDKIFKKRQQKKNIKLLEKNRTQLEELAENLKSQQQFSTLAQLQEVINAQYNGVKDLSYAPDLYQKINANWMRDLPSETKLQSIIDLMLPKTHDSAAYQFKLNKMPKGKWNKIGILMRLGALFGIKKFALSWAKCQRANLYEQLQHGVRALDLRVTYNPNDKKFYLSHSFICVELDVALKDIKRFMEEHPQEVVLISMKPDSEHRTTLTPEIGDQLLEEIQNQLPNLLAKKKIPSSTQQEIQQISEMNLNSLCETNQRVILINGCPSQNSNHQPISWSKKVFDGCWANRYSIQSTQSKLEKKLNDRIVTQNDLKPIKELSFTVTPSSKDIKKAAFRKYFPLAKLFIKKQDSLPIRSKKIQERIIPVINSFQAKCQSTKQKDITSIANQVMIDFCDHSPVVDNIIRMNGKK